MKTWTWYLSVWPRGIGWACGSFSAVEGHRRLAGRLWVRRSRGA